MATTTGQRMVELNREIERYREAATLTLEQLRCVINYLCGSGPRSWVLA